MYIANSRIRGAHFAESSSQKSHTEQYTPQQFDQLTPAINFSALRHKLILRNHEIYNQLPRKNLDKPEIVIGFETCESHLLPDDSPRSLTKYLGTERPLLGVHSVIFNDASFLTFYWPHFFMDLTALTELLREW